MSRYREATTYLCDIFEDLVNADGQLDFPESTFADTIFSFSQHIERRERVVTSSLSSHGETRKCCYFEVKSAIGEALVQLAFIDGDFFDYCSQICALNIVAEMPMPEPLRLFAHGVLTGNTQRPKKRARPRRKDWLAKACLWSFVHRTAEIYGLEVTRNDSGEACSACDAVAEALTVCGRPTNYSAIKNLMVHPDHAKLRSEFEASKKIMVRWLGQEVPGNALRPEYNEFWNQAAEADIADVAAALSRKKK